MTRKSEHNFLLDEEATKVSVFLVPKVCPTYKDYYEFSDTTTIQDLIVYMARISNPKNQMNFLTSDKLIRFLIKHKHWSPFDMINVVVDVETTRAISHQYIRHWTLRFQEFSQRYANISNMEDSFAIFTARTQDPNNKQKTITLNAEENEEHERLIEWWFNIQKDTIKTASHNYQEAVRRGIGLEQARCILPEGLTRTRFFANGSIRSWIHICEARTYQGAQHEARHLAYGLVNAIKSHFEEIVNFAAAKE